MLLQRQTRTNSPPSSPPLTPSPWLRRSPRQPRPWPCATASSAPSPRTGSLTRYTSASARRRPSTQPRPPSPLDGVHGRGEHDPQRRGGERGHRQDLPLQAEHVVDQEAGRHVIVQLQQPAQPQHPEVLVVLVDPAVGVVARDAEWDDGEEVDDGVERRRVPGPGCEAAGAGAGERGVGASADEADGVLEGEDDHGEQLQGSEVVLVARDGLEHAHGDGRGEGRRGGRRGTAGAPRRRRG
jgi:hypothetical protein